MIAVKSNMLSDAIYGFGVLPPENPIAVEINFPIESNIFPFIDISMKVIIPESIKGAKEIT